MPTYNPKLNYVTTQTVLGAYQNLANMLPQSFVANPKTTINYKRGVYPDMVPVATPLIRYFGWGIGGHYNVDDTNIQAPYVPKQRDMDLYRPMPFRLVPLDEDLTPLERQNYRMRVREEHHGQSYWAYYLKTIVYDEQGIQITRVNPTTGVEEPYELNELDLTPTPEKPSTDGVTENIVPQINVHTRLTLRLSGTEVLEAINVIFNGDMRYASVSEWGIYTGEDRSVSGVDHNNNNFNYTEAIYARLVEKQCNTGSAVLTNGSILDRQYTLGVGQTLLVQGS